MVTQGGDGIQGCFVQQSGNIHIDDVKTLATILENERLSHCRTRAMCFGLFLFSFVFLIVGIGAAAFFIVKDSGDAGAGSEHFLQGVVTGVLPLLAALGSVMLGFFGFWWSAQNCIHSIERSLIAAREGRHKLFIGFVEQVQCAGKKKREILIDMAKGAFI